MKNVYIVYSYRHDLNNSAKCIIGIYSTINEARKRQLSFGLSPFIKISNGIYQSANNYINFINILPWGDSFIEMFTTKID